MCGKSGHLEHHIPDQQSKQFRFMEIRRMIVMHRKSLRMDTEGRLFQSSQQNLQKKEG